MRAKKESWLEEIGLIQSIAYTGGGIYKWISVHKYRPYFTEATKAIVSMPPSHCLSALGQILQYKFTISSLSALYEGEMPWCLALSKAKHTGLNTVGPAPYYFYFIMGKQMNRG